MSKRKEFNSNPQENQKNSKSSHISFLYIDKNTQMEKSKSKMNIREKEIKFSYKPKSSYINNHPENVLNNNNINIFESKSSLINLSHQDNNKNVNQEKHKNIALSNKIEKNVIPIFNKRILLENKEKAKKNYMIISKCIKIDKINNDNININKGFAVTTGRGKKNLPLKYQLDLDNNDINDNNICTCYNNSIAISNSNKHLNENQTKIIKLENNFDFNKNIEPSRGKIINFDIAIIKDKKRSLKKSSSKSNHQNYSPNNNNNHNIINNHNNNFIHNILYNSKSNEKFNFEKYKKKQHVTSNHKNNNLYSYQIQAPPRNINSKQKNSFQQLYTINLKNNNQKLNPNKKRTYQNLFQDLIEKNQNSEKRSKSRIEGYSNSNEQKNKNLVNNNNININNVFINLDSINDGFFDSTEDKSSIKEQRQINKRSYSYSNIKLNNKKEININNNQILHDIKLLWKKIGGVNEQYKINFAEKLNNLSNGDKIYLYLKEKEEIVNLLNILDNLNKNINKRRNIHVQLKKIANIYDNNYTKIEDISKLLINLRMTAINIIKYYIHFKKEISYDLINNKYSLNNIINFPFSCLIILENDSFYLSSNEFLSSLFKFSKNSDPFLLTPSKEHKDINKNYYILPINSHVMEEIQKANYFLMKEKINRQNIKTNYVKTHENYNNNSFLISNLYNNKTNRNKFDNLMICNKVNCLDIINHEIKIFKKENIKCCPKISDLNIMYNKKIINRNILPCLNIFNYEYKNINKKIFSDNICITNNNNFEILKNNIENIKIKNYSVSHQITNFEIIKGNNFSKPNQFKNISICNKINTLEIKNIINKNNTNSNVNNQNQKINQNISNNIPNNIQNNNIKLNHPNQILCPYSEKLYPPIEVLYKAYIATVNSDIKISFKINQDINYYLSIGVSPKIILFKENNTILYGLATLSYDPTQLYKKSLVITSISCANNYSITDTLLQLVDYCNKEIEYDELIIYLYFYENENKKGEYLLNEEYKNMIKSKTLFKWTALENSGNERKIKYHYKKNFDKNYKENKNSLKILNNYIHIKFYRFIKYNNGKCNLEMTPKDYTSLFNIFDLIYKYSSNTLDNTDELNTIFTKLQGLKKKRLLKLITEFNYPLCNLIKPFFEELSKSEDKLFSNILLPRFINILKNIPKESPLHSLGFYCCDISTNFSSIIKRKINGYEYNIISINEFNIETFRLNNDINNEDYNNYIYFLKSQNESISFLIYELDLNEENNMNTNNNKDYKKKMFYKLLKRILTKDNDEPVKLFKKIAIPTFKYYVGLEKEEKNINENKIADYDILDGNDWLNFCIENNNENNLFSIPEYNIINEDIKIINNSFIIAIINPELTVDYMIPALNIYYINKICWSKR